MPHKPHHIIAPLLNVTTAIGQIRCPLSSTKLSLELEVFAPGGGP